MSATMALQRLEELRRQIDDEIRLSTVQNAVTFSKAGKLGLPLARAGLLGAGSLSALGDKEPTEILGMSIDPNTFDGLDTAAGLSMAAMVPLLHLSNSRAHERSVVDYKQRKTLRRMAPGEANMADAAGAIKSVTGGISKAAITGALAAQATKLAAPGVANTVGDLLYNTSIPGLASNVAGGAMASVGALAGADPGAFSFQAANKLFDLGDYTTQLSQQVHQNVGGGILDALAPTQALGSSIKHAGEPISDIAGGLVSPLFAASMALRSPVHAATVAASTAGMLGIPGFSSLFDHTGTGNFLSNTLGSIPGIATNVASAPIHAAGGIAGMFGLGGAQEALHGIGESVGNSGGQLIDALGGGGFGTIASMMIGSMILSKTNKSIGGMFEKMAGPSATKLYTEQGKNGGKYIPIPTITELGRRFDRTMPLRNMARMGSTTGQVTFFESLVLSYFDVFAHNLAALEGYFAFENSKQNSSNMQANTSENTFQRRMGISGEQERDLSTHYATPPPQVDPLLSSYWAPMRWLGRRKESFKNFASNLEEGYHNVTSKYNPLGILGGRFNNVERMRRVREEEDFTEAKQQMSANTGLSMASVESINTNAADMAGVDNTFEDKILNVTKGIYTFTQGSYTSLLDIYKILGGDQFGGFQNALGNILHGGRAQTEEALWGPASTPTVPNALRDQRDELAEDSQSFLTGFWSSLKHEKLRKSIENPFGPTIMTNAMGIENQAASFAAPTTHPMVTAIYELDDNNRDDFDEVINYAIQQLTATKDLIAITDKIRLTNAGIYRVLHKVHPGLAEGGQVTPLPGQPAISKIDNRSVNLSAGEHVISNPAIHKIGSMFFKMINKGVDVFGNLGGMMFGKKSKDELITRSWLGKRLDKFEASLKKIVQTNKPKLLGRNQDDDKDEQINDRNETLRGKLLEKTLGGLRKTMGLIGSSLLGIGKSIGKSIGGTAGGAALGFLGGMALRGGAALGGLLLTAGGFIAHKYGGEIKKHIMTFFSDLYKKGKDWVSGLYNGTKGKIVGAYNSAKDWVSGHRDNAKGKIAGAYNSAKDWIVGHRDTTKGKVAGAYNSAKDLANEHSDTTKGKVAGAYNSAKDLANERSDTTKGKVAGAYNSAKDWISERRDTAKGKVAGAYNSAKDLVAGHRDTAKGKVAGAYNSAKDWISERRDTAKGKVADAIGNLGKKLFGKKPELTKNWLGKRLDKFEVSLKKIVQFLKPKLLGRNHDDDKDGQISSRNKLLSGKLLEKTLSGLQKTMGLLGSSLHGIGKGIGKGGAVVAAGGGFLSSVLSSLLGNFLGGAALRGGGALLRGVGKLGGVALRGAGQLGGMALRGAGQLGGMALRGAGQLGGTVLRAVSGTALRAAGGIALRGAATAALGAVSAIGAPVIITGLALAAAAFVAYKYGGEIKKHITTFFSDLYDGAKKWVVETYEAAKNKIAAAYNGAKKWVVETYEATKNKIVDAYNGVKNWVVDAYEKGKTAAVNAYEKIKETTVEVYEDVKETVGEVYDATKNKIVNTYKDVKETAGEVYDATKNKIVNTYKDVKETAGEVYDGAKSKIVNTYKDTKEFLGDLFSPTEVTPDAKGKQEQLNNVKEYGSNQIGLNSANTSSQLNQIVELLLKYHETNSQLQETLIQLITGFKEDVRQIGVAALGVQTGSGNNLLQGVGELSQHVVIQTKVLSDVFANTKTKAPFGNF